MAKDKVAAQAENLKRSIARRGPEPNEIVPFVFEKMPVRVINGADGDPWFVAPDVCRVLELERTESALRILDPDEKGAHTVSTPGGTQSVTTISEPGLYKLLARSRKPEARRFDRWVRHEVLPTIRKTGSYTAPALTAKEVGGVTKAVVVKQVTEIVAPVQAEMAEMRTTMREFAADLKRTLSGYDPTLAVITTHRPMLAVMKDLHVPQHRRGPFCRGCSKRCRKWLTARGRQNEAEKARGADRWLYSTAALRDWLVAEGSAIIANHKARLQAQGVLRLSPKGNGRRS